MTFLKKLTANGTVAGLILLGLLAVQLVLADALISFGLPTVVRLVAAAVLLAFGMWYLRQSLRTTGLERFSAFSLAYIGLFDACLFGTATSNLAKAYGTVSQYGLAGIYLIGLGWVVWIVERANRHVRDAHAGFMDTAASIHAEAEEARRVWNPLDVRAWYYGRDNKKLHQSIVVLMAYSLVFVLAAMISSGFARGRDSYEMPGGGGGGGGGGALPQPAAFRQKVKLKKVVKKKFVINPYSSIIFTPPPIDDVGLEFEVATRHEYKAGTGKGGIGYGTGSGIGYGDGDGSGFAGGTGAGKIRFIRLEYPGGDWNQDFGIGADLNLLIEYGVRTGQKVSDQTESRQISALAAFPIGKSPPLVYLTGQKSISLDKSEIKTLREYLLDKHGMLFGDNGGSQHFHNQFFDMMRQTLPGVEPVKVPLDDVIHRMPYQLPFLPYVAPHGGREAYGWKVDGRWVCYYHPGDIGDAWSDGHSGVPRPVWEACYQLGVNVIFYAHVEYAKWLQARSRK